MFTSNVVRRHFNEVRAVFTLAEEGKLKESEVAKQACKDNPDDAENWKKWVMSLVRLRGIMDEKDLNKDMLTVAKKKLKEALTEDNMDLGFMWCLGEVFIFLVSADPSICESRHLYRKHCDKAIDCFDVVRFMDNDFGRGSYLALYSSKWPRIREALFLEDAEEKKMWRKREAYEV